MSRLSGGRGLKITICVRASQNIKEKERGESLPPRRTSHHCLSRGSRLEKAVNRRNDITGEDIGDSETKEKVSLIKAPRNLVERSRAGSAGRDES